MQFYFTNAARAWVGACEAIDIEGRFIAFLKVVSVPALVDSGVDSPKVSELGTVVRALEY